MKGFVYCHEGFLTHLVVFVQKLDTWIINENYNKTITKRNPQIKYKLNAVPVTVRKFEGFSFFKDH